jgi:hypothetical protein
VCENVKNNHNLYNQVIDCGKVKCLDVLVKLPSRFGGKILNGSVCSYYYVLTLEVGAPNYIVVARKSPAAAE